MASKRHTTESVLMDLGPELGTWLVVINGPSVGIHSVEPVPQPDVTPDVLRALADKLEEYRERPWEFPPPLERIDVDAFRQPPVPRDPWVKGYRRAGRPRKYGSADVARCVVDAKMTGSAITRAVAREFGVKPSYASVLIARARTEGFL
jgi:hypothetical protein